MLRKPESPPQGVVACEVCLKEIPRSVASSNEGADYVLYFCGDACFEQWQGADAPTVGPWPAA